MVHDIDRPDVNGVPPKMLGVKNTIEEQLNKCGLPFLKTNTDDNLCSSVFVRGSFDKREDWSYGIWENSKHFSFRIAPKHRYYTEGEPVQVEMLQVCHKLPNHKFRKYTGPVNKVIEKIKLWIESNK